MSIKCRITKRANGIGQTPKHLYHLKSIIKDSVDVDDISKRISTNCSLTHADVVACLSALNEELLYLLQQGHKVDLSWLGTFKISLMTESQASPDDCGVDDIRQVKVNYQPSKAMKKALQNSDFTIESNK